MPVTDLLERNHKLYGDEVALVELNPGSLTPKIPQSLDRLIFLCQIYFYVLRTIVLYGIMYLYIYNT